MAQIGNIPDIVAVKEILNGLHENGLVKEWILPHENLLTRLDAAIFFLTPEDETDLKVIWTALLRSTSFQVPEKYAENFVGA